MTRAEFVAAWEHRLAGRVLDACTAQRHGSELSIFVRTVMVQVRTELGQMYDQIMPPSVAPIENGKPKEASSASRRP